MTSTPAPATRAKSRGFTVVELLVVLAIVGILAAILLPVLANAREGARRATCASNLKQIGLAIAQYAQDNGRFYPHQANGLVGLETQCAWADRILRYVRNPEIFECPSAESGTYKPGCPPDSEEDGDDGFKIGFDGSYNLNSLTGASRSTVNEVRLQHPSDTVSAMDGAGIVMTPRLYPSFSAENLLSQRVGAPRHGDGYNVLWIDGHVTWRTLDSLADRRFWIPESRVPSP